MTIIFRARTDLLENIRADLDRPHRFAKERVGFIICNAGRLSNGGIAILAMDFDTVADEDYLSNPRFGALMGPAAIRKALQRAYNDGKADLSVFHVHMHGQRGVPEFSNIDDRESRRFVPDFFNVAPDMPHGAIVLSRNNACGYCWATPGAPPVAIDRFASVGAPLKLWWRGS
jgi:hypothetical protein